jgi:O-antigen ligase
MTVAALPRPRRTEPALLAGAGLVLALAVGVATAREPRMGLVLILAAIYVPLVLADPPLGIALWIAASFLDALGGVGLALSGGTVVILLAAVGSLRRDDGRWRRSAGVLLVPFVLMLTWFALSLAWSAQPELGAGKLLKWLLTSVLVVAVVLTVRTPRDVRLILAALIVGPAVSVIAGLVTNGFDGAAAPTIDTATSVGGRLVGGVGDPNFLAIAIVSAIVLATVLGGFGRVPRAGLAVLMALLVVGLLATQSRGGLIAAVATVVAAVAFMTGQRGKVLLVAATVVAMGVLYLAVNPAPLDRVSGATDEGNGRAELWGVALDITADHPVGGVGLENFVVYAPRYVDRQGPLHFAELIAERPHVVHNTYLEVAVETGIVGVLLFGAVIVTCIRAAWTAARIFERSGRREMARLSRGVLLATIAVMTGGFFLSFSYRGSFWMFMTLCVVMLGMAVEDERETRAGA